MPNFGNQFWKVLLCGSLLLHNNKSGWLAACPLFPPTLGCNGLNVTPTSKVGMSICMSNMAAHDLRLPMSPDKGSSALQQGAFQQGATAAFLQGGSSSTVLAQGV